MKHTQVLTLSLALLSSMFVQASDSRVQREIAKTQTDIHSGLLYLLTQVVPCPAGGPLGTIMKHARKVAVKDFAGNHLPENLGNVDADLPVFGNVTLLDNDQLREVAYAGGECWMSNKAQAELINCLVRTYGREKIVQCLAWLTRSLCGEGSCPMTDNVKNSWLVRNVIVEVARHCVDQALTTVVK